MSGLGHSKLLLLFSCSVVSDSFATHRVVDLMDCSPPDSSVHGISQGRILEWVAIPFSRGSSRPKDRTWISCISCGFFTADPLGKPLVMIILGQVYGQWSIYTVVYIALGQALALNILWSIRPHLTIFKIWSRWKLIYLPRIPALESSTTWLSAVLLKSLAWIPAPSSAPDTHSSCSSTCPGMCSTDNKYLEMDTWFKKLSHG